jgi:hypothetical protein
MALIDHRTSPLALRAVYRRIYLTTACIAARGDKQLCKRLESDADPAACVQLLDCHRFASIRDNPSQWPHEESLLRLCFNLCGLYTTSSMYMATRLPPLIQLRTCVIAMATSWRTVEAVMRSNPFLEHLTIEDVEEDDDEASDASWETDDGASDASWSPPGTLTSDHLTELRLVMTDTFADCFEEAFFPRLHTLHLAYPQIGGPIPRICALGWPP